MRKIKASKLGGPRVKWNETVFCTHCADTGKDRKTAECVKNNLTRHNRRWHPDLDPIKEQAWMLVWPGDSNLSTSPFTPSSLTNFLRASPRPSVASQSSNLLFPQSAVNQSPLQPGIPAQMHAVIEPVSIPSSPIALPSSSALPVEEIGGNRKRRQTVVEAFGPIALLDRTLQKIRNELLEAAQSGLTIREKVDLSTILFQFRTSLIDIQNLKNQFEEVQKHKKMRLDQVERIASKLVAGVQEKEELIQSLKVAKEQKKESLRPGFNSRIISRKELSTVDEELRGIVEYCLKQRSKLELVNGVLECTCCRDNWSVAGISVQPNYQFKCNLRVSYSIKRHWEESNTHRICSLARDKFDNRRDFYRRSFRLSREEANIMTENILRTDYFLLRHDLSINLFESFIELLDCCKTMIGNQLHSRNTARAMALMIDEMFQGAFVRFLLSDKLDEFTLIGDELTDVGGMKVLLTKLRFFENEWDLQEMVFSIFESSGDSIKMVLDFTQDFVGQFLLHSNLSEEEILEVISKKLQSGGSDRASKMLKFSDVLSKKLGLQYTHFKCDNHVNETAWEEVQKVRKVEMVENVITKCFGLFKNSASRKLKLAAIAKEYEERSLRIRGLFAVKYLTSEKDATESFLVDYLQLLKLTDNLRKDKKLKKEQRENVGRLLTSLRNARVLINAVALHSALEEAVAPYQLWSQKMEASAFEREFQKTKLFSNMKAMKESSRLPDK